MTLPPRLSEVYGVKRNEELTERAKQLEMRAKQQADAPPQSTLPFAERQRRAKWECINGVPYPTEKPTEEQPQ